MTTNTLDLRTATLDDIVFEGRNKAYGAFVIRQLYHRHLARASATAIVLSLLLISSPLVFRWLFPPMIEAPDVTDLPPAVIELITPPLLDKPQPAEPAARVQTVVRPPLASVPTKVVKDELAKPEIKKPEIQEVGPVVDLEGVPGLVATPGSSTGSSTGAPGATDSGSAKAAAPPKPFITAEVMPQFVGGNEALVRYLQKNLHYPPQALRNNVEGRVFISFTVQADGSIADVQVLKGLGYGTDEEASRVVRNMPAWTPGQQNKRTVAVRYTLPITFKYE